MTTRVQALRSSTTGALPAAGTRLPGELWTNFADLQAGVIDASKNAQRLIAVRYFSTAANYVAGDFVIQAGVLYVAKGAITAGAFNAANWTQVASATDTGGPYLSVAAGASTYLPLAGGTLTGLLTLSGPPSSPLHAATKAYADTMLPLAGGTMTGLVTLSGPPSNPLHAATKAYVDAGAFVPLAGGTMTGPLNGTSAVFSGVMTSSASIINAAPAQQANILGEKNGVFRWVINLGDATAESGSDSGSDFDLGVFNDAGSFKYNAVTISRATGRAVFQSRLNSREGYIIQPGVGGVAGANTFNINWSGASGPHIWIDSTDIGQISTTSDYRIKKDIQLLGSMWERVKALNPISYTHKAYTPSAELERNAEAEPLILDDDKERWGFVAHELQETLIEDAATGVKDQADCIQSPNPWTVIATLTKALQEAMTRIEALEAGGNAPTMSSSAAKNLAAEASPKTAKEKR